jgi:hypothetical protein
MSNSKKVLMLGEGLSLPRTQWQLDTMLQRAGLSREMFQMVEVGQSREELTPGCVIALGKGAMNTILPEPFDKAGLDERRGYVEWSQQLGCWVIPTYDPSFIMRGQQKLTGVWLNDVQHAINIAKDGYIIHRTTVLEDPTPMEFFGWIQGYELALNANPTTLLAYDIETLGKQSTKEDELDLGDQSYTITRIGFCYKSGEAASVPWSAEYMPHICRLMSSLGTKVAHNGNYDRPRVIGNGVKINGLQMDTMWAWHVANSDLEKGLGFVATFCCPDQPRWKHLGKVHQAFYNACDAEVTLRIMHTITRDLQQMGLWQVYLRHVCELDQNLLWPMCQRGVLLDNNGRLEASKALMSSLEAITKEMAAVVPPEACRMKVYKSRPPKDVELVELEGERKAKRCSRCLTIGVTKPHVTQKTSWAHTLNLLEGVQGPQERIKIPNPCLGATIETVMAPVAFWGVREAFVPSNSQLQTYQAVMKHRPQLNRERKPTFDDEALQKLVKQYKTDLLYPLILQYRNVEKVLGTYIGVWNE